ncbi:MAG: c-type cytochrome [Bacteroidales bacterium]|nr:c-type cytochrome [Bacteroidales bacterium]MCF8404543.1 c-type cytochrome [Bacteroidales bacterium]
MSTLNENSNNKQGENYEIDTLTNDRLIADHDYDGIKELDNDLPPWWKWLFYICIAFGIIYLVRLFVMDSDDLYQDREFNKAMAEAASMVPARSNAEFEIKILTDSESIKRGKETYDKICQVCHLMDGGGLVGPNFTDNYWIHGNSINDWFSVVTNGVIEKGMIAYKDQLSPTQRLEVLSYIATLHGTTPANPKAPQGEEMEWLY